MTFWEIDPGKHLAPMINRSRSEKFPLPFPLYRLSTATHFRRPQYLVGRVCLVPHATVIYRQTSVRTSLLG